MVVRVRRFSREDYHRLAAAGVLHEDDRVELIEGIITHTSPIGPQHNYVVDLLNEFFVQAVARRAVVRIQGSVGVGARSEPEPDVALLKPPASRYRSRHAEADDILLLVEVADASIEEDRGRKARLYARGGVREYWVIDLIARRIAVHREPSPRGYGEITEHASGENVSPLALPDVRLGVSDCLP